MNLLAISHYRYRHYFLRTNSCECYCYIKGKECIKAVDVYCPGFTFNLSLCHLEFKASNPYLNCTKVSSISSLGKNTLWPNISHRTAFSEQSLPAIQETRVQSLSQEDPLEKGMTTRYSILAWRIPWTEKPGGLPSMGSQRVRHDWGTNNLIEEVAMTLARSPTELSLLLWTRWWDQECVPS